MDTEQVKEIRRRNKRNRLIIWLCGIFIVIYSTVTIVKNAVN